MDFLILRDSIALPWCMDFYCLCGLAVSYGGDCFMGKLKFWFGFMILIVLVVFGLGMAVYGFYDLRGFHSSATVHGFLDSWLFRGLLNDD